MIKKIKTLIFIVLLLIPATTVYSASTDLIEPQKDPWAAYEVLDSGRNQITLKVNGETFAVTSRFSMPNGTWNPDKSSTGYFNHTRTVDPRKGYIHITDTFTNRTAGLLPLKQWHTSNLKGRVKEIWCGGLKGTTNSWCSSENSSNPTTYATTDKAGIGIMTLSDEMQVHVYNWSAEGILGLADNQCVIPPGSTYSAEWVIVPTQRADFWDFVNACRRIRNVNFTQNHMFAFLPTQGINLWSDDYLINFIRKKAANVVSATLNLYDGVRAHGTLFQKLDLGVYARHNDRIRRLLPDVKTQVYFDCYLQSDLNDLTRFYNDRTLMIDGTQATYANTGSTPLFFPTMVNEWGKAMAKNVDSILGVNEGDCKADGLYWDVISFGWFSAKYHYCPWDGSGDVPQDWDRISGDIDRTTGELIRLKSATILLSREWILSQIQKIMQKGPLFINNGSPHIRSIYNLHCQSFAEISGDWDYSNALLYSPVALGKSDENNVIDSHRGMIKALNYGLLYNWYQERIRPQYVTLTKYMFPITPIELHEGYIIGQERIVTNRSGSFGWGDNSVHEVHVFNDEGREVLCFKAPRKTIEGKSYTELLLAKDWTAAIIRQPEGWTGPINYCPNPSPWLNLLLGN